MTLPREKADELLADEDHQFLFEMIVGLAIFGTEIPIGRLRDVVRDIAATYAESEVPGGIEVVQALTWG